MRLRFSRLARQRALVALLTISILSVSCQRTTPPGGNIVSGKLDNAGYTLLHWDEGLRVMLWVDITDGMHSSGSGSTGDPTYRMEGYAAADDGRRVEWTLQTTDGKRATFNINGQPFDLASGALFLIKLEDERTQVQQVHRDLSTLEPTNEGCEAFADTDPDVQGFIAAVGGGQ